MAGLKWFSSLYNCAQQWSRHHHAPYYLAGVSFIEASFFPIPPDVMLISMGLAKPHLSWRYAAIATFFSVLGGLLGYAIGFYAMSTIEPYLLHSAYAHHYARAVQWFSSGGIWMVILAGVTPFPYKIFAIAAGAMHMALIPFIIGSIIGRGMRFFLVSCLLYFVGEELEQQLRRYIDRIGFALLLMLIVGFIVYFAWS